METFRNLFKMAKLVRNRAEIKSLKENRKVFGFYPSHFPDSFLGELVLLAKCNFHRKTNSELQIKNECYRRKPFL